MRAGAIVEGDPPPDHSLGVEAVGHLDAINRRVFQRPPRFVRKRALDEDVVHASAAPVHGDFDLSSQQPAGELGAGELAAIKGQEAFDPISGGDAVSRPRRGRC